MPARTRSQAQTTLEDKGVSSSKPAPKRKVHDTQSAAAKKQKTATGKAAPSKSQILEKENGDDNDQADTVTINRAPVLELWASCVAHVLHPSLSWSSCLSIGSSISTLAAISRGRSIGKMEKPDPSEQAEKREKRAEEQADLNEVHVLSFKLKLKDGNALVGDQPKKGNEEALKKKFGEESYNKVKIVMEKALESWKGKEDELNERAFHMYEDFRPSVSAGQKGWGRKGSLRLDTVRSVVENA